MDSRLQIRVLTIALAIVCLIAPLAAEAQPAGKVWRIGYLAPSSGHSPHDEAFERSMKDLGYVEGQNLRIERRYIAGRADQYAPMAVELVRLNVDLIVVWSPPGTEAVKNATSTIPIVFLAGPAIEHAFVAGLARPGGNLTGVTFESSMSLEPKYLEMLKEVVPGLSRAVVISESSKDAGPAMVRLRSQRDEAVQAAARSMGIRLSIMRPLGPGELPGAFASIEKEKPQALIAAPTGLLYAYRREFIEFAAKNRLPTMYGLRELVPEGGLMSLSPSLSDIAARGAFYVDKILKGAQPADLPVEQPTKFELIINMKTAKALGLTIPQSLLLRADEVIQ